MKLVLKKELLELAVSRMQGAITERSLAHIGLMAKGAHLHVAATDRVLAVYSSLDASVKQEGTIFVPARIFSDLIRQLPSGDIRLETSATYVVVTAGEGDEFTMKLPLIDDLVWRDAPTINTKNIAELSSSKLSYMIDQVQFCVAHESARNYGAVGFFHKTPTGQLRLVGTDGFRLSFCETDIEVPKTFLENGVCLSKRALSEIQRMCGEGFENIKVAISDDQTTLLAEVSDYRIFVRLSAVKYPNYMGVMPAASKMSGVDVSRPHMQNVARRVLLAADKTRALQLKIAEDSLTLQSRTMGSSESKESINLEGYKGPGCLISVNGKFLEDVFSTSASDQITLQFKNEEVPIVITPKNEPNGCHSKHVLVPIRENESVQAQ